jgi:hypothetical protein
VSTSNGTSSRPVDRVLAEVAVRFQRDSGEGWLEPSDDGTGYAITQRLEAERAATAAEKATAAGDVTWAALWRADVLNVMRYSSPASLRLALMHAITLGVQWVADIDTREEEKL